MKVFHNLRRLRHRKSQLRLLENTFSLIIIFIIFIIIFTFIVFLQKKDQATKLQLYREREIVKKTRILNFLPEIQCSDNLNVIPDCYDIIKMEEFSKISSKSPFYRFLLGNINLSVRKYDPSPEINEWGEEWHIYDNPKKEFKGIRYVYFPILLYDPIKNSNYFGIIYLGIYR